MNFSIVFVINSILLGVGLAMDAFSVSLANGLGDPVMKKKRMCMIAGVFAVFQAAMPLIGWVCVHTVVQYFESFEKFIPWIALILLGYIGIKMIREGIEAKNDSEQVFTTISFATLMLQGVATSIDALSVGFTIADYGWSMAFICAVIISVVTFIICMFGLMLGKKFGTIFAGRANIFGGIILIGIGLEIFISSFLG